jgi:hypothetical protein
MQAQDQPAPVGLLGATLQSSVKAALSSAEVHQISLKESMRLVSA